MLRVQAWEQNTAIVAEGVLANRGPLKKGALKLQKGERRFIRRLEGNVPGNWGSCCSHSQLFILLKTLL